MAPALAVLGVAGAHNPVELVVGQRDVRRADVLVELVDSASADDGDAGEVRLFDEPAERDLCGRGVKFVRDSAEFVKDVPAALGEVEILEAVGQRASGAFRPLEGRRVVVVRALVLAREEAAGQRRVRTDRDVLVGTHIEIVFHVVAVAGVEQRLGHLEALVVLDVALPQGFGQLPGGHRRRAEVVDRPRTDEVVKRRQRLLDIAVLVPTVDVVEVEIVRIETVQCPLDLGADVLAAQAGVVGTGLAATVEGEVHLRGDNEILAVVIVEPLADVRFAGPVRIAVDVGSIDEVDAALPRRIEQVVGLLAVGLDDAAGLPAEAPGTETEL